MPSFFNDGKPTQLEPTNVQRKAADAFVKGVTEILEPKLTSEFLAMLYSQDPTANAISHLPGDEPTTEALQKAGSKLGQDLLTHALTNLYGNPNYLASLFGDVENDYEVKCDIAYPTASV